MKTDYTKQEQIKKALETAKWYCIDNIPIVDGWTRQGLESHLKEINELLDNIGITFMVTSIE